MVEDKVEPRSSEGRPRFLWTELFQGFRVALDFNKLILAAAGILVMAFGWWLLAIIFNYSRPEFNTKDYPPSRYSNKEAKIQNELAWRDFKLDREKWRLMHQAAGNPDNVVYEDAADVASSQGEYEILKKLVGTGKQPTPEQLKEYPELGTKVAELKNPRPLPAGELRTWPWFENRGPNPYLLATGQTNAWQSGHFWDWLFRTEVPVLLEPLRKMIWPIVLFFHPNAGALNAFYFLLVMFWTIVTWAIFGGAITRIAAVQVARQEKLSMGEAVRFTGRRWFSFVAAPLFPLLFVGFLLLFMIIFGFFHMIPWFGDVIVDGLFWWLMVLFGLLMAVGLIGLVGWPLMSSTVSTEGTDSWEAVSRSYSYVFQAPWHYFWYGVVATFYGIVIVFFVGFMGSFTVYLSKWGVSQTPWVKAANRDPSYLFVYAPTSFGWRDLLLKDVVLEDGSHIVSQETGRIIPANYDKFLGRDETYAKEHPNDVVSTMNAAGARMVAFWLGLFFLLILGFGYSYFWSASAIIYLLMRRKVDDQEMDEVYLEEEADTYAGPLAAPQPAPAPAAPARTGSSLPMVESPTLRPTAPAAPTAPPIVPAPVPPKAPEPPASVPPEPKTEPAATEPPPPAPPAPQPPDGQQT